MPTPTDPFSIHEALDRTHLLATTFYDFVQTHPFVEATPDLRAWAEQIGEALGELYQAVGRYAAADLAGGGAA